MNNKSISNTIIKYVSISVVFIVFVNALVEYNNLKNNFIQNTQKASNKSIELLKSNIKPLIEAYAIHEYMLQVKTELMFHDYLAIIVEDYNLAQISSDNNYRVGYINDNENLVEFNQDKHEKLLKKSYKTQETKIYADEKEIGKITIYQTDKILNERIEDLIINKLINAFITIFTLIIVIYFLIKKIIIKPVKELIDFLKITDTQGIPNHFLPIMEYAEYKYLAQTINNMIETIKLTNIKMSEQTKEIKSEKNRFQLAIEGTKDGLWDWDLTTDKVVHSERFETMLGYDAGELPDSIECWSDLLHPDDKERTFTEVKEYLSSLGTETYDSTFRMKTKSGEWLWITGRGKALFNDEGKAVRFVGFNTDIDKTKKLQDELMQTNEELETINKNLQNTTKLYQNEKYKYKHILDLASDGIFIMNLDGNLIEYSNKTMEMLGYNAEEMHKLSVFDWDKELIKEQYKDMVARLEESHIEIERVHTRKDGSSYLAQITASLITIDGGEYIYSSARDITDKKELENEIIRERNFISTIIDTANAIIAVIDADGTMSLLNNYGQSFTGYTSKEIASEPYFWKRFLKKDIQSKVTDIIAKANNGEIVNQYQNAWVSHTGEEKMFEWSNQMVTNEDGTLNYVFTIGIDIEQKVQAQLELKSQKDELEAIFDTALEGIAILDTDTKYLFFNKKYLDLLEYTQEELQNKHCYDLTAPEYLDKSKEIYKKVLEDGFYENFERICITKSGKRKRLNSSIALMSDKKRFLMSTVDHTELYDAMQLIKRQTYIDELTKLNNRKSYNKRISESIASYRRYNTVFSLLMFDIDFFKSINDTFGHQKGDEVLVELSRVVKATTRANDYIFRIGGEEFIILLTNTPLNNAASFAEKLRSEIESGIKILKDTVVTVSIGVTEVQADDTENSIFKRVDNYLYDAKESGRNKVVFG